MNIKGNSKIHDVIEIIPFEDYKLIVKFDDGLTKTIDIKPFIGEGISKQLEDKEYFQKVYIDNGAITWPNGYDFCPLFVRDEI